MMRRSPSTNRGQLVEGVRLSRVRALATFRASARLRDRRADAGLQLFHGGLNVHVDVHGQVGHAREPVHTRPVWPPATPVLSLVENPLSRPAMAKLAASRLTSHSHGPEQVSSKSLMPTSSWRSGDGHAEVHQVGISNDRCVYRPACAVPASRTRLACLDFDVVAQRGASRWSTVGG